MRELLLEMLAEYNEKFQQNKAECIQLMKDGKPWEETAKKGAGLKLMIETTLLELTKYPSDEELGIVQE